MLLKISDRVALMTILPEKGNFVTLKIVTALRELLGFNADEIEACKIVQTPTNIKWDTKADAASEKDIDILPVQMAVICDALRALDGTRNLMAVHLAVYEKFMGNKKANG